MQNYTNKLQCRVCASEDIRQILDLNVQPLANSYHSGDELEQFPLDLNLCRECHHLQLGVVVDPDLMFKEYLYVSGTSKTLNQYFRDFVDICHRYVPTPGKVLDIACNDGTQLDKFKEMCWDTYGVDPAANLHEISSKNHRVECDYWTPAVAKKMACVYDVLVAQNVFAHVDDVHEFLQACKIVMGPNSRLFIQTSQADMITNNEFDTIYHEHLSYFNTKSMKKCANLNGFSLVDTFKTAVHGGSYVFVLAKGAHDETRADESIMLEDAAGLYSEETYDLYKKNCITVADDLVRQVNEFRSNGMRVVGYGAAAKGNTFLNFSRLKLDYIVDDNELKQGLRTPGQNILIKSPDALSDEDPNNLVVIPLAWNFFEEIRHKTCQITGPSVRFVRYFPEVNVL